MEIFTQRISHLKVVYTVFYAMLVLRNFCNMKTDIQLFHLSTLNLIQNQITKLKLHKILSIVY